MYAEEPGSFLPDEPMDAKQRVRAWRQKKRKPRRRSEETGERDVPMMHPLEIKSMSLLNQLLSGPDNVMIMFYSEKCPHCIALKPIWNMLARQLHMTNNIENAVPIIVAKMDGQKFYEELKKERADLITGYPTLFFKRSTWQKNDDYTIEAMLWDNKKERTYDNILEEISTFYGDATLRPLDLMALHEHTLKNGKSSRYIFLYSTNVTAVPRFSYCLHLYPMLSVSSGVAMCAMTLMRHPRLLRQFFALPVNELDRPDLPIPTILDKEDDYKEYRYRDAQRLLDALVRQQHS
jgi:thiol-disulfide isomerase/thioredoxin